MAAATAGSRCALVVLATLVLLLAQALGQDATDTNDCTVDEIHLASDGTIEQQSLTWGDRVAANMTLNGSVVEDESHFYHVCILRHEHEHLIRVNLTATSRGGQLNLFLSSEHKYPQRGRATWISQHPRPEVVNLYTYLDGFPRKSDAQNRSIPLHLGVQGVSDAEYTLTVSVVDLEITSDRIERERYYTQRHTHNCVPLAAKQRRLRMEP